MDRTFGLPLHHNAMAYAITITPETRTGLVTSFGYVTGQELVDACVEMLSAPNWEPGYDEVWDLSQAPEIDVTPSGMGCLVESAHARKAEIGESRCVFVISRDGVAAVLRLFECLTQELPRTCHISRTLDEAEAWLGLAPGVLRAQTTPERALAQA